MATCLINDIDTLKILGIHFDRKLLWGHVTDHLVTCCPQHLGALYCIRDYLGQSGIVTASGRLFDQSVNMEASFSWGHLDLLHICEGWM